jgi:hypothetical protein
VAEIPTIWLDRQLGTSQFDLGRFLPRYLRWYWFAFAGQVRYEDRATHEPGATARVLTEGAPADLELDATR